MTEEQASLASLRDEIAQLQEDVATLTDAVKLLQLWNQTLSLGLDLLRNQVRSLRVPDGNGS